MNIKKLLTDFSSWVFAGLTFLGFIIIYAGFEAGDTNWFFVGTGIILILPFAAYLIKTELILKKSSNENFERISELIRTGDKLTVDLDKLEIQTNSYKQEIEVGNGYNTRNENIDVNHNVILIDIPYKNESIKYKLNIDMDSTKLKMHFAIKEKTELYVDSKNPNNNYLDLRFLES